jgi:hypothetical protein
MEDFLITMLNDSEKIRLRHISRIFSTFAWRYQEKERDINQIVGHENEIWTRRPPKHKAEAT